MLTGLYINVVLICFSQQVNHRLCWIIVLGKASCNPLPDNSRLVRFSFETQHTFSFSWRSRFQHSFEHLYIFANFYVEFRFAYYVYRFYRFQITEVWFSFNFSFWKLFPESRLNKGFWRKISVPISDRSLWIEDKIGFAFCWRISEVDFFKISIQFQR